jgi:hypothetical protein
VHPYARRLSVRARGGRKERHPVPRNRGRGPVRIGLIVQTGYRPQARWEPAALSAGECVLALLSNTVPARDRPAEVLATLVRASDGARGLRGDRGPAARTARALIALAVGGPSEAGALTGRNARGSAQGSASDLLSRSSPRRSARGLRRPARARRPRRPRRR